MKAVVLSGCMVYRPPVMKAPRLKYDARGSGAAGSTQ
jgi:hypothetical protein